MSYFEPARVYAELTVRQLLFARGSAAGNCCVDRNVFARTSRSLPQQTHRNEINNASFCTDNVTTW